MNDLDRADLRTDDNPASWLTDQPSDIDPERELPLSAVLTEGRYVRPAGWTAYHLVDVVVDGVLGDDELVLLVWATAEALPSTLFGRNEVVAVQRWGR